MSQKPLWVDAVILGVATLVGALMGEGLYLLSLSTRLIVADYPCGTYLQPYSCLAINPGYQLLFPVSGAAIGSLFYFVDVMHKNKLALRMELILGFDGLVLGLIWIIASRYASYFGQTAYFGELFIVSIFVALAGFLGIDHLRVKASGS